jgi:triphosphatase
MEVELKLLVSPEHLARIERHPAVKTLRRPPRRKTHLVSIYYDTPELDLVRAGVALRLRQNGAQWVQTLKGGGEAAAGLHAREELEWVVAGQALDLALLHGTPYRKLFERRRVRERLRPVFTTEFDRTASALSFPDGTAAELALDLGDIRAGNRTAAISEAEIELKTGAASRLFEIARALAHDVPLRLGHASKAERGYALARRTIAPQKARSIPLDETLSAGRALRRVVAACVGQMQANEEGMLQGRDPEFLHQLRVGLRRLRAALGLLSLGANKDAMRPLAEELRWLQNALGPARDWDVFMGETFPPLARMFAGTAGLAGFRARCARVRRMHATAAREAVRSERYTDLVISLGELCAREEVVTPPSANESLAGGDPLPEERVRLDAPVLDFAAFALERRSRKLSKRGGDLAQASPAERHEVRIAAKKLRYAAEFFGALYAHKKVDRYVKVLERLQDILGALNDAAVVNRLLDEAGAARKTPLEPRVDGLVRGWVGAVAMRELAQYEDAWTEFEDAKPFWR